MSVLALPVIVAISAAIGGSSKSEPAAPGPSVAKEAVSGGDPTWGVTTEPACFDAHRSSQQNSFWVIRNYIDSLISKRTDGTYAPWLAKSWSIAADGKSYTFNLRDDVRFTDGTAFAHRAR